MLRESIGQHEARTRERAAQPAAPGSHPMEIWISYVLRVGVLTAGAIILIGIFLFLTGLGAHTGEPASLNALLGHGGHTIAVSPASILHGVAHGDAIAVIQLGVLALILTPMMRVGMTIVLFALQHDHAFTLITAVVFLVLVLGLIGVGS